MKHNQSKNRNDNSTPQTNSAALLSPKELYEKCIVNFHKTAMENGFTINGVILIPQLIPFGEKFVSAYHNDDWVTMACPDVPRHFTTMTLCLDAGAIFADKWVKNGKKLSNAWVNEIIKSGPAIAARILYKQKFGWDYLTVYVKFCAMYKSLM